MYIENKMSEIDNLCEISVFITRAACFFLSNANLIFRLITNNLTHRFNKLNIFKLCKITINCFVKT